MQKITPFLWFDTQAEEAAKFYVSLFKNSKIKKVTRYTDAGPAPKGTVMTVEFKLNGQDFVALNGGPQNKFNQAVSFVVNCKNQKEVDKYWRKLTENGGQPNVCGWLTDKYGLSWQIVPTRFFELIASKNADKVDRVMRAMMQMTKMEIDTLEAAAKAKAPKADKPKKDKKSKKNNGEPSVEAS